MHYDFRVVTSTTDSRGQAQFTVWAYLKNGRRWEKFPNNTHTNRWPIKYKLTLYPKVYSAWASKTILQLNFKIIIENFVRETCNYRVFEPLTTFICYSVFGWRMLTLDLTKNLKRRKDFNVCRTPLYRRGHLHKSRSSSLYKSLLHYICNMPLNTYYPTRAANLTRWFMWRHASRPPKRGTNLI